MTERTLAALVNTPRVEGKRWHCRVLSAKGKVLASYTDVHAANSDDAMLITAKRYGWDKQWDTITTDLRS